MQQKDKFKINIAGLRSNTFWAKPKKYLLYSAAAEARQINN
jgi:hypothetical protein